MENIDFLIQGFAENGYDSLLADIYVDASLIEYQKTRYINALKAYAAQFGQDEVSVYSAPGRSEVGGNHTDHQHGEVLAASVNLDAIGIVAPTNDNIVYVVSDDDPLISVDLHDLTMREEEKGTTTALIKGVLAGALDRGYRTEGFRAYITSDVPIGAGLSSSAALETLIGTIVSGLYNNMRLSSVEIAVIGQYAENVYFGKPCGLMDQMACAVGGLIHIDFASPTEPFVEKIDFDLGRSGYSLCITDTKGSHADLTEDYAAIPAEMQAVAAFFGKDVLREVTAGELFANLPQVRKMCGDRAVLRAIHFIWENVRVKEEVTALKEHNLRAFLSIVKASGDSSFKYLQNVYTTADVSQQNLSVALAVSESILGASGVCRIHGGGFAGTIQAFVKNEAVASYQKAMDSVFGKGSCRALKIRGYGGMKVL